MKLFSKKEGNFNPISKHSVAAVIAMLSTNAGAADIVIDSAVTTQQVFSENNQSLNINEGGSLIVSGENAVVNTDFTRQCGHLN